MSEVDVTPAIATRREEAQGFFPALQPQGPNQPDDPDEVIRVEMREEDVGQREPHPVAHHLALGAFAAVEQQEIAIPVQRDRGDVALHCGASRRGAEKRDAEHGENICALCVVRCA